jgi:hypothetical protein
MSGWRALADKALGKGESENTRDNRNESPPSVPSVPSVPPLDPVRALKAWRSGLESLSWDKPLHGLEVGRWRGLLGDAHWLLDHFGGQAARDGWSAADLFGVCGVEGFGGVAERLRSSRSLVMGADLATWRRVVNGTPESFARGIGKQAGFTLLWEGSQ